jgi:hypothetical protein
MQVWPTNHVLLKLKIGVSIASLAPLMDVYQASYIKTGHVMVILKIADIQNALVLSNLINESGFVEWANPDFFIELIHSDSPKLATNDEDFNTIPLNDPLFPEQFQMHNTGQTVDGVPGLNDADCNALEAWDITTGSSDIIVAVIDDGTEALEDLGNVCLAIHLQDQIKSENQGVILITMNTDRLVRVLLPHLTMV